MENPFKGQREEGMAPPDLGWHFQYEVFLAQSQQAIRELESDPAFKDAEDLGDWLEALGTLLSFAPRSRQDIQQKAREE